MSGSVIVGALVAHCFTAQKSHKIENMADGVHRVLTSGHNNKKLPNYNFPNIFLIQIT